MKQILLTARMILMILSEKTEKESKILRRAGMAELADAPDLGSGG